MNFFFVLIWVIQDVGVKVVYNYKSGVFNCMYIDVGYNQFEVIDMVSIVVFKCFSVVIVFFFDYDVSYWRQCFNLVDVMVIIFVLVYFNGMILFMGGLGVNVLIVGNSSL